MGTRRCWRWFLRAGPAPRARWRPAVEALEPRTLLSAAPSIGTITGAATVAGSFGDGTCAPAARAELNQPSGLALDLHGNVLVADSGNDVMRQVTLATVSPLSINPTSLPAGTVGTAYRQQLSATGGTRPYTFAVSARALPTGLALTPAGLLSGTPVAFSTFRFTVQATDHTGASATLLFALKINATFTISAQALPAHSLPTGIAVDNHGNRYLAEPGRHEVLKVTPTGAASVFAGTGTAGFSGDGGLATRAQLNEPLAVAFDPLTGNVDIADALSQVVRQVTPDGKISTIAGTAGVQSFTGDHGQATAATLFNPSGLAFDGQGNLYIADANNNAIRLVSTSGVITTFAGTGTAGHTGDHGPASQAELNMPLGLAFGPHGTLYIADTFNNAVRAVSPAGTISTFAGTGFSEYSGDLGPAGAAELDGPTAVTTDALGNVYVFDLVNHVVRAITSTGGLIDTVAGNGLLGHSGNGGSATAAELDMQFIGLTTQTTGLQLPIIADGGLAIDAHGNLDVTDFLQGTIRQVNVQAPRFVSAMSTTFTLGQHGSFTIAAAGFPAAALVLNPADTLPAGVQFDAATGLLRGTPTAGGTFTLHFTASNGKGPGASQTFTLTVDAPPAIVNGPADVTTAAGDPVTLQAIASGTPAPTVQWQVSTGGQPFTNIKGATKPAFTLVATVAASGNQYRAVFTNALGQQPTAPATLTVTSAFFVAPGGSDANPGTQAQPFKTIQHALDVANQPGATIQVASGTYLEKVSFPHSGSAAGGFITLQALPGAHPILSGAGVPSGDVTFGNNLVQLINVSYVRLSGFELESVVGTTTTEASAVHAEGAGSHLEILNNTIHDISGAFGMGISVYGSSQGTPIANVTIDGNTIFNCAPATSETLTLNGNVTDFQVTHNVIHDCNNIGIDMIGGEASIFGLASAQTGLPVARNGLCAFNTVCNIHAHYNGGFAAGIYVDGGRDITVLDNVSYQNDVGLEVGAENAGYVASGVVVENNLIYRNTQAGLGFGGFDQTVGRVQQCRFLNNTIVGNDTTNTGDGQLWIQWASDNIVSNNIFVAAPNRVLLASFDPGSNVNNQLDHNLYFASGGADRAIFNWNGTTETGFANYTASGEDAHPMFDDPLFVHAASADFHLQATSPAIGAGASAAGFFAATDFTGATRHTPPDLGAYEHR